MHWAYTFTYDDVGNRETETDKDSNVTTYTYNAGNQLTGTNAGGTLTTYTYDNNGNLSTTQVAAGTTTNTYDYENRVLTVTLPAPATTTFTYDGEGKRLTKVDSSGTIKHLYDQSKVVLERDSGDNNLATYTHEGGSLFHDLISVDRTNSYWYLFDGLGSVVQMVDASENTQNSYTYEAFGQIKSSSENVPNRYKFVGAYDVYYDATPALYFMQARYYDPWRGGRFITTNLLRGSPQDPPSLHQYLYVSNNPICFMDPNGLQRSAAECFAQYQKCSGEAVGELGRCIREIIGVSDVAPSLGVIAGCAAVCGGLSYLGGVPGVACFILCLGLRGGLGYIVGLRVCGRLVLACIIR